MIVKFLLLIIYVLGVMLIVDVDEFMDLIYFYIDN